MPDNRQEWKPLNPLWQKARPMGLRAGLDSTGFNRLVDDLDTEAFLETTRKLVEHGR
jgi:hypothetical protein